MTQPLETSAPAALETWLAEIGFRLREIEPLPGDVSPRRYARLLGEDGVSAILATYPQEVRAACPRFVRASEILTEAGVRVPRILGADCGEGRMLLEDLGPATLGDWKGRPWNEAEPFFFSALDVAGRIARLPGTAEIGELNPTLGRELLRRELQQTWDLFLEPRDLTGDAALTARLRATLDEICERLGAETPVPCHRDFMARNLMPIEEGEERGTVAVLDHQDLRLGPPEYDLASLLNDTLFPPPDAEEALLAAASASRGEARVRYHRAAAQRTLKAVGTYTSFALRGAGRHLPLVPPTLARCLEHLARVPESADLTGELARVWSRVFDGIC
jgi:hypothetical protein